MEPDIIKVDFGAKRVIGSDDLRETSLPRSEEQIKNSEEDVRKLPPLERAEKLFGVLAEFKKFQIQTGGIPKGTAYHSNRVNYESIDDKWVLYEMLDAAEQEWQMKPQYYKAVFDLLYKKTVKITE